MSEPLDHLFRREAGRIAATLARIFGTQNLALAEDVVQEAFCRALEVWPFRGVPDNPSAWLMATARNCALDALRRERTARRLVPLLDAELQSEWTLAPVLEEQFAPQAVSDDLLRMMFSCCPPRLQESSQVALILHILCGFSVHEVAGAFLTPRATIAKRIARAKSVLAQSRNLFDLSVVEDFSRRLPAVQRALYLLFNEGYHGAAPDTAVHTELCGEARRLTGVLLEHPRGAVPSTYALGALMALNAARLPARVDPAGNLVALADQDRTRWDQALVAEGLRLLDLSAVGSELSAYHVESAIAAVHAAAASTENTDWRAIVALYDQLLAIAPSPIVALNRAIAIAQAEGPERGLAEVRAMVDGARLSAYPFYPAALGELELRLGRPAAARRHFLSALALARSPMERRFIDRRLRACDSGAAPPSGRH